MNVLEKIRQYLVKVFVRRNKRFPTPVEFNEQLDLEARKVFDGALRYNLEQSKGKNLDEAQVMEQTMNKNADQLVDDYLSYEAMNIEPTFTVVDETKLPRADIEALPLKDKEKAEAAVRKKLEAQNVQAKQSKEGGETPGGPQRGRPEVVDENFRDTIYIDKSEMQKLTDQAWKYFDAAESAMAQGKFDDARAILKYEIADNYQFPANIRDAADDARNMIDRNGLAWKDMGYESYDEGLEAFNEKIAKGQQQTMEDNWVDFTDPLEPEKQKPQRIEYVSFFDEPGEDFGTPNDSISDISKLFYNYAKGGRVGFEKGGVGSAKDFIESTGDPELMDIYIKVLDGTLPEDALAEALEKKGYKTYATGGRVGFSEGGIKGKLIELINKISKSRRVKQTEAEDFAKLLDDIEQAKKAGIIDEAGFKSFQRGIESMRSAAYDARKIYPTGIPGQKSGLPADDKDLVPKTNLGLIRNRIKKDKEGIQSLADENAIPVRDDTAPKYRFTGRETEEDLYKLEEQGIITRSDHNVYDPRYLEWLDARVKYYYGYTKGQMNKIQNQPARLNYLRAQVSPRWGEAHFGSDYMRILEKERGIEASGGTPEFSRQKTKSKNKLLIPTKKDVEEISDDEISKAYNQALLGNDLDGSDKKYDAQIIADYLSQDRYKKDFYDLPQSIQLDLYEKSWKWLNEGFIEELFEQSKGKGPINIKTGKDMLTGKKVMDVPDDDVGMFDNVFDEMFSDYKSGKIEDYIPGEEPLTPKPKKTPRRDNAEGGLNYLLGF